MNKLDNSDLLLTEEHSINFIGDITVGHGQVSDTPKPSDASM